VKSAGYTEIINETNIIACKDLPNALRASKLFSKGYKVALFINAWMLDAGSMRPPPSRVKNSREMAHPGEYQLEYRTAWVPALSLRAKGRRAGPENSSLLSIATLFFQPTEHTGQGASGAN
jgi:hypothetical protein